MAMRRIPTLATFKALAWNKIPLEERYRYAGFGRGVADCIAEWEHVSIVTAALVRGETVSPYVLADYPHLREWVEGKRKLYEDKSKILMTLDEARRFTMSEAK